MTDINQLRQELEILRAKNLPLYRRNWTRLFPMTPYGAELVSLNWKIKILEETSNKRYI